MEAARPIRGLIRLSSVVLWMASLLAPKAQRQAWLEKQRKEVWHWLHFLLESGQLNAARKRQIASHLWRAFSDALWSRFNRDKAIRLAREVPRAPRFCLISLGLLLIVVVVASGFAPTVRGALWWLPYKNPDRLVQLSFSGPYVHYPSDTLFLTTSRWSQQSKTAESLSAYSWEPARMTTALGREELISARVASNFFDVMGVNAELGHVFHPGDQALCPNCIVISNGLWEHGFHRDRGIVGKQVAFQGTTSTVIGVLPARFWFISREISVWTFSRTHARAFNNADRTGAVLRLRPGVPRAEARGEFDKFVHDAASALGSAQAELAPIQDQALQGVEIYLLFALLALIGSMAILTLRLARSISLKMRVEFRENYRWWLFFAAKTVLLIATCFVASLEGTRWVLLTFTGSLPSYAGAISSWLLLVTTVLAITWSLHDQYRRCRICLKRLEHESYVGVPARLFLDWWGTELVCSQGHGLLHVPEMKASWLEDEQWIQLDDSWKPLFESEEAKVL
ncbi:MAG TPA: ABC transporter permease [Candidatus Angelobacter sp.]